MATRGLLAQQGYSEVRMARAESDFDGILAILLLRSDIWQLKQMERLPDCLATLGLHASTLALAFALGHTDDFDTPDGPVTEADQRQTFENLSKQPAGAELPSAPSLGSEQTDRFHSIVLGCAIQVTVDNRAPCIELAESLLAAIESLLATSVFEGVCPRVAELRVRIRHSDFTEFPFSCAFAEHDGLPVVEVRCPDYPRTLIVERQHALKAVLADLVVQLLLRGFFVQGEATLDRLFAEERGLQRAIDFTGSFGTVANSLGQSPKLSINDWAVPTQTRLDLRRREVWNTDELIQARIPANATTTSSIAELTRHERSSPDDDSLDLSGVKHSDIGFESLIREPLWNRARWRAIGWAVMAGAPPWMILAFENRQPAADILTQLVRDIGTEDPANRLRITIVKGISRTRPFHYRVVIGSNIDPAAVKKVGAFMFRLHTMEPTSGLNLDRFLAAYNQIGAYLLGVGVLDPKRPQFPELMRHGYVLKRHLHIREAWEIGINDIDGPGVLADDDVQIPDTRITDAPVLELLQWKRDKVQKSDWPSLKRTRRQGKRKVAKRPPKKPHLNRRGKAHRRRR